MHEADAIDVKHLHWLHCHPEGKGGSDLGDALHRDDADAGTGPETGAAAGTLANLGHFGGILGLSNADAGTRPETGAATGTSVPFAGLDLGWIGTGAAAGTSGPFTGSDIGGVLGPGIAGTSGPPKMR